MQRQPGRTPIQDRRLEKCLGGVEYEGTKIWWGEQLEKASCTYCVRELPSRNVCRQRLSPEPGGLHDANQGKDHLRQPIPCLVMLKFDHATATGVSFTRQNSISSRKTWDVEDKTFQIRPSSFRYVSDQPNEALGTRVAHKACGQCDRPRTKREHHLKRAALISKLPDPCDDLEHGRSSAFAP